MRKLCFSVWILLCQAVVPGAVAVCAAGDGPATPQPASAGRALQPVDGHSTADVPATFLTQSEADQLTALGKRLGDRAHHGPTSRSRYAVAQALAAIAEEASEGDTTIGQVLDDLKAERLASAVRSLNANALIKEAAATRSGAAEDAKDAASAWRTLGALAYLIDDHQALAAYTKASSLDRDDVASVFWVGNIQTDHEYYEDALSSMKRVGDLTKIDPAGLYAVWAHQVVGSIAMLEHRGADAFAAYRETRRLVDQRLRADPGAGVWRYEDYYVTVQLVAAQLTRLDYAAALNATADERAAIEALAASAKDDVMILHHQAAVYGDIGMVRSLQGAKAEAIVAYNAQLAMAAEAVRVRPGDTGRLRDLEAGYRELGLAQGNSTEAAASIANALALADQLAALEPNDAERVGDRAILQADLGDIQAARGDLLAADQTYIRAFETFGRTQHIEPDEQRWRLHLVRLLNKMGDVQMRRGDLDSAVASYRGNVSIGGQLAAKRPNDIALQGSLFVAYRGLGDVQRERGDYSAALAAFDAALAIDVQALRASPRNKRIVLDIASMFSRIGTTFDAKGALGDGRRAYDQTVRIMLALSKLYPDDMEVRHNLAIAYDSLGEMQWKLKDATNAAISMRAAQTILLANQTDEAWWHDLALSYSQYGALEVARGNLEPGLNALKDAEELFRKIAAKDPDNADAQHEFAIACLNAARGLETASKLGLALGEARQGQAVLKSATRDRQNHDRWKADIAQFDEEVTLLEDLERKGHI